MDREKMLKKWQAITLCEWLFTSAWYFITLYNIAFNPDFRYNFVNMFMWFVLLCVFAFIFNKNKPEQRKIMPMIISIHDTVEKLKKQRIVLIVIGFILIFSGKRAVRNANIILMAICSTWIIFVFCANLLKEKIEYLKQKPEGMNF